MSQIPTVMKPENEIREFIQQALKNGYACGKAGRDADARQHFSVAGALAWVLGEAPKLQHKVQSQ